MLRAQHKSSAVTAVPVPPVLLVTSCVLAGLPGRAAAMAGLAGGTSALALHAGNVLLHRYLWLRMSEGTHAACAGSSEQVAPAPWCRPAE